MDPLLKWPGSKRRISSYIADKIGEISPKGRYIELFAGGASVFFHMEPKRAVLVDACKPLIAFYEAIQREPAAFSDELERLLEQPHEEATYNKIKREWNGKDFGVKFAARLLYLNKLGFNGLFRLNKDLEFNVAWGKKTSQPAFPDRDRILQASDLLRNAKLYARDYSSILKATHKDDVVFADPPYWETYDRYAGASFDNNDHRRLARGLRKAVTRGVNVFASNIDCKEVRNLYCDWASIETVSLLHKIGCTSESRKKVDEVFMTAKAPYVDPRQVELFV